MTDFPPVKPIPFPGFVYPEDVMVPLSVADLSDDQLRALWAQQLPHFLAFAAKQRKLRIGATGQRMSTPKRRSW